MVDNRLTEAQFHAKYPGVKAASITASNSGIFVNTALTAGKYIKYNWQTGEYDIEPR